MLVLARVTSCPVLVLKPVLRHSLSTVPYQYSVNQSVIKSVGVQYVARRSLSALVYLHGQWNAVSISSVLALVEKLLLILWWDVLYLM